MVQFKKNSFFAFILKISHELLLFIAKICYIFFLKHKSFNIFNICIILPCHALGHTDLRIVSYDGFLNTDPVKQLFHTRVTKKSAKELKFYFSDTNEWWLPLIDSASIGTIEIWDLEHVCLSCSCKHFGRKNPCKKSADLHPRIGNLLHWNIFIGLNKTSLHYVHTQNR
jgi:hypothetical protein